MKNKRKISAIITLIMMFMLIIAPFSAKAETLGIYVRVEGLTNTIAEGNVKSTNGYEALKELLDQKKISYDIKDGQYGKYVDEIDKIKAPVFGDYDGWMYVVKDGKSIESGQTSIDGQKLKDGDTLIVYYGDYDKTAIINHVTFSPETPKANEEFTMTLSNKSLDYETKKDVIVPVKDVSVEIDGKSYKSDDQGQVKLTLSKGSHKYKFSGYSDGKSVPTVLMDKGTFDLDEINKPQIVYSDIRYNEEDTTKPENVQKPENAGYDFDKIYNDTLKYMSSQKSSNWAAFSLYKSGVKPEASFLNGLKENVEDDLDDMYPTQLQSAIIGLASTGYTPYNFCNKDLVSKLYNSDINNWLTNDIVFGLLTYNAVNIDGNYKITKSILVNKLLDSYNNGWSWSGKEVDLDTTAAAINALAPYYNGEKLKDVDNNKVKKVVDEAVKVLSNRQNKNGDIVSKWGATCETNAFAIMALTSIGVDPQKGMFKKENGSLVDAFLSYKSDNGMFNHNAELKNNAMATEQAFRALICLKEFEKNRKANYYTSDINLKKLNVYKYKETSSNNEDNQDKKEEPTSNKKEQNNTNKDISKKNESKTLLKEIPKTGGVSSELLVLASIVSIGAGLYLKKRA